MNGYGAKGALKSMFPRVAWRQYLLSPFSDFCGGGLCPLVSVFLSLSLSFPWDLGQLSPLGAILGSWDYCFVSSHLVIVGKGPPRVPTPLISIFSSSLSRPSDAVRRLSTVVGFSPWAFYRPRSSSPSPDVSHRHGGSTRPPAL